MNAHSPFGNWTRARPSSWCLSTVPTLPGGTSGSSSLVHVTLLPTRNSFGGACRDHPDKKSTKIIDGVMHGRGGTKHKKYTKKAGCIDRLCDFLLIVRGRTSRHSAFSRAESTGLRYCITCGSLPFSQQRNTRPASAAAAIYINVHRSLSWRPQQVPRYR